MTAQRKLIEVAIPLEEINAACKADKDRKTGTIRNLHKWFAPAPLPAWRALLFAALVDDPEDDNKRVYLQDLIKRLVANGADLPDDDTLEEARAVIRAQFPDGVPTVMDPFCGGGSTLVEAQRLGLPTYGSDLNPVPVLITRTLTQLLPAVHGRQPLHPEPDLPRTRRGAAGQRRIGGTAPDKTYSNYDGIIRDVTYYAEQIRDQAWQQLKDHYPHQPGETPIAWLWARTATCPNPACGIRTILTTSWWLSKKKNDLAWIQPRVDGGDIHLDVVSRQHAGTAPDSPKVGRGTFACIKCGTALSEAYLRAEGKAGRLGQRMTAVVTEAGGGRTYRHATGEDRALESLTIESDLYALKLDGWTRDIRPSLYGLTSHGDLYTPRQLRTLTTFADLVADTHQTILDDGGTKEWADAVTTLLGLAIGRLAQYNSSQVRWFIDSRSGTGQPLPAFGRNDLPMTWDFAETSPLARQGSLTGAFESIRAGIGQAAFERGETRRADARVAVLPASLVATDPPYFDAIGYADLSDYFYVWHRRALGDVHPDLYGTMAAPKSMELTAVPSHHGGSKDAARDYFIDGFTETFKNLQVSMADGLPMLVIYASKEQKSGKGEETRWEAILTAMVDAGLEITGTWPIHMTSSRRMVGLGANAVAAYIVMVCRPRDPNASTSSLGEFVRALHRELPGAIEDLQAGSVLPVDLPQAVLGPGMSLYSRYRLVEDATGTRVPVGRAIQLINEVRAQILQEQEGELDAASRFAVSWWEEHGWEAGPFGQADQYARQFGTFIDDVVRAQVATAGAGKVRLLGAGDLDRDWTPQDDAKPTAWEAVHHLADRLIDGGGETEAAALLARLGDLADPARALAYRLYDVAAAKDRTKDQERYNALIGQWTSLVALAATHTEGLF